MSFVIFILDTYYIGRFDGNIKDYYSNFPIFTLLILYTISTNLFIFF